jgi:hypothetical protein
VLRDPNWCSGPPYSVNEVVFDEDDDFPACEPIEENAPGAATAVIAPVA